MGILFIAGFIWINIYSMNHGHFDKLFSPVDGDNRICGYDKGVKDYPYLYLVKMDPKNIMATFNYGVCVKGCPANKTDVLDCVTTKNVKNCSAFPSYKYDSSASSIGFCAPVDVTKLNKNVINQYNKTLGVFKHTIVG
jgi:hypothetical protein